MRLIVVPQETTTALFCWLDDFVGSAAADSESAVDACCVPGTSVFATAASTGRAVAGSLLGAGRASEAIGSCRDELALDVFAADLIRARRSDHQPRLSV
jgi:hypothetical protein